MTNAIPLFTLRSAPVRPALNLPLEQHDPRTAGLTEGQLMSCVHRAARLAGSDCPTDAATGMRSLRLYREFSESWTIRIYASMALAAIEGDAPDGAA